MYEEESVPPVHRVVIVQPRSILAQRRNTYHKALRTPLGRKGEKEMAHFMHHEFTRDLQKGTAKSRRVKVKHLAEIVWCYFLGLLLKRRKYHTRVNAILEMVFVELVAMYPHLIFAPLLLYCRKFLRTYVFKDWKFQKQMDLSPCGGFSYSGLESVRKVEGLEKWEQGAIPSEKTVRNAAEELELYAAKEFGLEIITIENEHGKVSYL